MELNEIKYGFKLVSIEHIKDINSTLYQYEHIKSGGKVVYLANDDTNCCFTIGFRTLPEDSTGVCHIIEHSLLCGSKKYPLKEPFVNLLKTSLATFLNAFTAYDWTMYPFASQTPKDFDNILSIYLDAVFNPICMVDKKPFLQEGWHLELLNENDTPSYKGVVYNEMKGAMSSVDEVLVQATLKAMYKDTFYRHNSGGDPDIIPTLSYEAYQDFYRRHYTPQNAMTYFYGALNIEEKLKFLDEEYFSKFDKVDEEITIIPQEGFINLNYQEDYEIGEGEDVKDNTYMSLCYGLDHYKNYEEYLAMNILAEALLSKNDSPLKKAMLEAKLGQNVEARIDDDNIIPALHVYLQKTNPNKKEAFKTVFEEEVRKLVKNGIDKELLLATINHMEFVEKEMDTGRMPKGLILAMTMMGSFNYNTDLKEHLEFSKHFAKFKQELNNNYFENMLEKYILNSKHHVQVVINPDPTLSSKKKKAMDDLMKEIKNTMTEEDKKNLVNQTKELLAYQNKVDSKAELKTLPKLNIKDIPNSINYLDTKKLSINGMKVMSHNVSTNGIAYLRMYFDVNKISFEDLPYVYLLRNLLLNVSTNKYDVNKLNNLVKTYLGDLSFSLTSTSISKDKFMPFFKVSASALNENVSYIPTLINEVLLHSKFSKKEVKQVVVQLANDLKQSIIGNGMQIAMKLSSSCYDLDAAYLTNTSIGPKVYEFFNNLAKNYNHLEVNNKLKEVANRLFNKHNVNISISGDAETLSILKDNVKNIKLPRKEYENVLNVKLSNEIKNALIIPSGVSYNSLSSNLENINESFKGSALVLTQIVNYDYLWAEIRVKGGAYGCGLSIGKNNNVSLGSYRDPNVTNTYKVFKDIVKYLDEFKVSKEEFKSYVIGSMSNFDAPLSIPSLINVWDINYLANYTKKDKLNLKKEVLKTTLQDVKAYKEVFEKLIENSSEYTIGNIDKIKEYDFKAVKSL